MESNEEFKEKNNILYKLIIEDKQQNNYNWEEM